jgi:hypothetical protein
MSEIKKILVVDVDDDIEGLIVHHPSGDEEIIVLGRNEDEDNDDAGDDTDESVD